jgi:hypothetical protein
MENSNVNNEFPVEIMRDLNNRAVLAARVSLRRYYPDQVQGDSLSHTYFGIAPPTVFNSFAQTMQK